MSLLIERGTVTPMARKYWRAATFGKLPIAEASSGSPSSIFRFHLEVAHFSVTSGAELLVATTASELLPAAGAELLAAPIDVSARAAAVVGVSATSNCGGENASASCSRAATNAFCA